MTEKLKTVRLETPIYKALREFQSEFFVRISLEAAANAALAAGIDSLRTMMKEKKLTYAKKPARNTRN